MGSATLDCNPGSGNARLVWPTQSSIKGKNASIFIAWPHQSMLIKPYEYLGGFMHKHLNLFIWPGDFKDSSPVTTRGL